jgi:hypothetical protein
MRLLAANHHWGNRKDDHSRYCRNLVTYWTGFWASDLFGGITRKARRFPYVSFRFSDWPESVECQRFSSVSCDMITNINLILRSNFISHTSSQLVLLIRRSKRRLFPDSTQLLYNTYLSCWQPINTPKSTRRVAGPCLKSKGRSKESWSKLRSSSSRQIQQTARKATHVCFACLKQSRSPHESSRRPTSKGWSGRITVDRQWSRMVIIVDQKLRKVQ